jgi:hypothetical protein
MTARESYTIYVTYITIVYATPLYMHGVWNMARGFYYFHMPTSWGRGEVTWLCNQLTTYLPEPRSYAPYAQVPRRLRAGTPLTILWFAPLVQLHPVLGFCA